MCAGKEKENRGGVAEVSAGGEKLHEYVSHNTCNLVEKYFFFPNYFDEKNNLITLIDGVTSFAHFLVVRGLKKGNESEKPSTSGRLIIWEENFCSGKRKSAGAPSSEASFPRLPSDA